MPWPNYQIAPGGEFTTTTAAESAAQTDWNTNGGNSIVTFNYETFPGGLLGRNEFQSWSPITTADNYVVIQSAPGHEHNGISKNGFYFNSGNSFSVARLSLDFIRVKNIAFYAEQGVQTPTYGSYVDIQNATLENVLFEFEENTVSSLGIFITQEAYTIENMLITNRSTIANRIFQGSAGDTNKIIRGVTIINYGSCSAGIHISNKAGILENTVVYGTPLDFSQCQNMTAIGCASGDTSAVGTNPQTGVVITAGVDFTDAASGDYTPVPGGKLAGTGSSPPTLVNDITGYPNNDPSDIGAYALQAAGGISFDGPDIINQTAVVNQPYVFDENGEGNVASRFTGAVSFAYDPLSDQPAGITIDSVDGNPGGTPTQVGTYTMIIEGSDQGGGNSPEAQAVLDRMTALTAGEETAIITFVDGLVADGVYDLLYDCWLPALSNSTDSLTGFKVHASTVMQQSGTMTHVPGDGWRCGTNTSGFIMSVGFDTLALNPQWSGALHYFTNEGSYDTASNGDYWGLFGTDDTYLRNRAAADSHDVNIAWNQTTTVPRPPTTGLLHEDVCGAWASSTGTLVNVLSPAAEIEGVARTSGVAPTTGFCWSGRNDGAAPQNAPLGLHRFWAFINEPTDAGVLLIRTRVITLLQDLGAIT